MTIQIFVKGGKVARINHDFVTATDVAGNATGCMVYYMDGAQTASYIYKQAFTTAAGGCVATATAASATIEAFGTYPNPSPETVVPIASTLV